MLRLFFSFIFTMVWIAVESRTLQFYIEAALLNSPLINEYKNNSLIEQQELERLRAVYKSSRLETTGEYLFVPIVSKDDGKTSFKWNAQDGSDYYGYDLGERSGHLHAGLTLTQPLLGGSQYRLAKEQSDTQKAMNDNFIRMEKHSVERTVREHYILCLLDMAQMAHTDSVAIVLEKQRETVSRLASQGFMKRSDVQLLDIEVSRNADERAAVKQSFHSHLMDLNLICGINDTADVALEETATPYIIYTQSGGSIFDEQYRLDSISTVQSFRSFRQQYLPRLDAFIDGGLQTSDYSNFYRHFGWSAGLTFSLTLYDGKQQRRRAAQRDLQLSTISVYRSNAERQRQTQVARCRAEIETYAKRETALQEQLSAFDNVLNGYEKEMRAGQLSLIDYLTTLRNKLQTERDLLVLRSNKQLAIVAYNYWNK